MRSSQAISEAHFPADSERIAALRGDDFIARSHTPSGDVEEYLSKKLAAFMSGASARYAAALTLTVLGLLGRWLLAPALGDHVPFALVYAAVVLSALFLGLGPSIVAGMIGVVGVRLFFAPHGFFAISSLHELSETLTYLGGCFLITAAAEMTRRSKDRLKSANMELAKRADALAAFNEELEKRVTERTIALRRAEASARSLGAQVMRMQDEERRRIARELHESVGQAAAVLSMNLGQLERSSGLSAQDSAIVLDTKAIAKSVAEEVRTISYLLHPPLLDEMGLPLALQWFVKGFSRRSGIHTDLEISQDFGRLAADFEIAIFRIVQEALTNVLRHSGSARAAVRLARNGPHLELHITDEGKGMRIEERDAFATGGMLGVGLRGMRERAAQLGGRLDLRSSARGTIVSATFPVGEEDATSLIADHTAA